ncbi:MAG: hypothetical protein HXY50_06970 [Ignavibacteriaceae bacterium]|nr:hypothetical protein [Ignavibacteriaceae bacterium]
MKKKLILLVTFLFLISTTGLPITLHYCQMQGSTSIASCEMCLTEEKESELSCCEEESDIPVRFTLENTDGCCVTKFIESSVKDGFLVLVNNVKNEVKNLDLFFINNTFTPSLENRSLNFQFSDSSPPLSENHIYLLNSVLLI